ncbi:MAG: NDP-sugar synthase, partial [Actinomycetota bacterium]|nr:NDP-sugar synthase [Actinomycetota bacterium]
MKALLLTGGLGTRLRPLTNTRPKPLLPIANRPHIEHVFDMLQRHEVSEVVLTTSHLPETLAPVAVMARELGLSVDVTYEAEPLGTAGAIRNARDLLDNDAFYVLNGDVLTDVDLRAIAAFHRDTGGDATIFLVPVDDPSRFGVVPTDPTGRVTGFIEKPARGEAATNNINAGVYVLEPAVLDAIPHGVACSIERDVFPQLVNSPRGLFAHVFDSYWIDVGTPESYLRANMDALAGRVHVEALIEDGTALGAGARVAPSARLSSACLGPECVVADGSSVVDSVLLPRVQIGAGAVIEGSILGEAVVVDDGVRLVGATLGDGEHVSL